MTKTKNKNLHGGQAVQETQVPSSQGYSAGGKTFILSQPLNFIFFISFFSPIILVIAIVSMSFVFQNFKGLIYLGFMLGISVIRRYALEYSGSPELKSDGTICTSIQFSKYGNATFSTFIFAFTLMYLCMPMFQNGSVNWMIFSGLIFYIFLDLGIKAYEGCLSLEKNAGAIFMDLLTGLGFGVLISTIMYLTGNGKYMFFNEVSSDKEVCSMPKKQTFKCAVYKNGELVK
jgi:hypothetical protein